jgi:hypothetical protein
MMVVSWAIYPDAMRPALGVIIWCDLCAHFSKGNIFCCMAFHPMDLAAFIG